MATRNDWDEAPTSLANEPPTKRHYRSALAVVAMLLLTFAIMAPFADVLLPRIDSFIPVFEAIIFVTDFITAVLLFSQYAIYQSRALLILSSGYLFTSLIVIPHALTFPYAFSPNGLLGADLQSAAWLYVFWHTGFPAALFAYAWLKDEGQTKHARRMSIRSSICLSVASAVTLVCGLAWLAIAGERFLPPMTTDSTHFGPWKNLTLATMILSCLAPLLLLFVRRRSVLDLWLMVVVGAMVCELIFAGSLSGVQFSLGWYVGRGFSLATSTIVLTVLLVETSQLYARLARSYTTLRHERDNKLMSIEAVSASIAHEIAQPLTAVSANAGSLEELLSRQPLDLEQARVITADLAEDTRQTVDVLQAIRGLFSRTQQRPQYVNMNDIVVEAIQTLRFESTAHRLETRLNLSPNLPLIAGHTSQLREVVINLVRNALEAMANVTDRSCMIEVTTQRHDNDKIVVAVKDTGPGIDPARLENLFDGFVTTKQHGMGLGLALCHMIVERHGGQLSATSDGKNGALFQFILPVP